MEKHHSKNSFHRWLQTRIPLKSDQSPGDEKINALTHLAGFILALFGTLPLILRAVEGGRPWMVFSASAYSLSMLVLYGASTMYHWARRDTTKRIGRIFDHLAIYLLIAGTYTPITFRIWEPEGPVILTILWAIVAIGFIIKILFWQRFKVFHVAVYLAMGWLIVFFWKPVTERIPREFLFWALAGGLSYTIGVAFYAQKRFPYHHAIWHLFVLGGSIFFYLGIYYHILV
jgi:hemolysin III